MKKQTQAYLYASASVLMWATVATAFKLTLRYIDYIQLLLFSSIVSAALLLVVLVGQGKIGILAKWRGKDILRAAFLGFLNPFLYYLVLFKAYSLLPAQQAQPLNYTWPIAFTILAVPLLGQKIDTRGLAAILVAFVGVLVISTEGSIGALNVESPLGVGLAVGSSVIWALFWIMNMRDKNDPTARFFTSFCFGSIYILIVAAFTGRLQMPSMHALIGSTYVGLFEMGLTFVFWFKALGLSRTTVQVSILIYLAPFLSLVLIHFLLGEPIAPATIVGLVLIVGGITIKQYKDVARALKKR